MIMIIRRGCEKGSSTDTFNTFVTHQAYRVGPSSYVMLAVGTDKRQHDGFFLAALKSVNCPRIRTSYRRCIGPGVSGGKLWEQRGTSMYRIQSPALDTCPSATAEAVAPVDQPITHAAPLLCLN